METERPWRVPENPKLFNSFDMRTNQAKILEIRKGISNGTEILGEKFSKTELGYIPREVVLFFRNSRKCYSICYWKFRDIQTGIFGRTESACYHLTYRYPLLLLH